MESKVCSGINKTENSTTCRGCKRQYKRLLPHLNSKNGKRCRDLYTEQELEKPSKEKKYYDQNREKLRAKKKEQNKCFYDDNREEIHRKKKEYYEANKEKILQKRKVKRENLTLYECLKLFRQEIIWGPIFPCICCHRMCYRTGVTVGCQPI